MERKLEAIFDYQRFEKNAHLDKIITETENRSSLTLTDEELCSVNAAGFPPEIRLKEDKEH